MANNKDLQIFGTVLFIILLSITILVGNLEYFLITLLSLLLIVVTIHLLNYKSPKSRFIIYIKKFLEFLKYFLRKSLPFF